MRGVRPHTICMGDVVCVLLLFVLLLAVPQLAFAQQDSNEQGASSTSVDVGAAALDPVVPAAAPQAPSAQSAVETGDAPGADPATYSGGSEDVGAWANPGDVAGESSQGELGGGVDAVENPLGSEGFDNVEGEGGIEGEAGEGEGEGAVPGEDEPQTENDEGDSDKKHIVVRADSEIANPGDHEVTFHFDLQEYGSIESESFTVTQMIRVPQGA